MINLLNRVKRYFSKPTGLRRPDFWVIFALFLALVGGWRANTTIVCLSLLPAFLAGFYLACDSWPEDDGPDDGDDDFEDDDPDDEISATDQIEAWAKGAYDLKA